MQVQFFQSIVEFIRSGNRSINPIHYSDNRPFTCIGDLKRHMKKDQIATATVDHGYNGYLKFVAAYKLHPCESDNCFLCVSIDRLMDLVKYDDIIVVNIGLHYDNASMG